MWDEDGPRIKAMIISVASGKGGTGKTTVAVGLALSGENVQFLDCDVEEPNAHIFIKPVIKQKEPVHIYIPEINKDKCNFCGRCQEICSYNAIAVLKNDVLIFKELCHSCGACSYLCPQNAIKEVNKEIGFIEMGSNGNLHFVGGRLNIGEAISTPVIKAVKKYINSKRTVIIDVPPGTSCPVIESVKGSDYCILVTEPTPFGLYDLTLTVEVLRKINIPFGVVINRSNLGYKDTIDYCKKENIPILMRIPFKKEIAHLYSRGVPFVKKKKEYLSKFKIMMNLIQKSIC